MRGGRGRRVRALIEDAARTKPDFVDDIAPDKLLSVILRLAMEISVLRERSATQEALLKAHGILAEGEIDAYEPGAEETASRTEANQALIRAIWNDLR